MESREEFATHFARYSKHGKKFEKAIETVLSGSVKRHIFSPSGRVIYTVVGRDNEEFIDPGRPFCSCNNFFFKVLSGEAELCYHLLSYGMASESKNLDTISFSDEEYAPLLSAISRDILENLREQRR